MLKAGGANKGRLIEGGRDGDAASGRAAGGGGGKGHEFGDDDSEGGLPDANGLRDAMGGVYEKQRSIKIEDFAETSCGFLTKDNPLRSFVMDVVVNPWFDRMVIFVIICNCVVLAMYNPDPDALEQSPQKELEMVDIAFTVFFTLEMFTKIIAMGFLGEGSYLSDSWNQMDFAVVVLGYFQYIPGVGNYTAVRTIRVLRPLRTITGIEGMRVLVSTLLQSLPMLLDVVYLCAFLFFIFGIVSVQLLNGTLRQHCVFPPLTPYFEASAGSAKCLASPVHPSSSKCYIENPYLNATTGVSLRPYEFQGGEMDKFFLTEFYYGAGTAYESTDEWMEIAEEADDHCAGPLLYNNDEWGRPRAASIDNIGCTWGEEGCQYEDLLPVSANMIPDGRSCDGGAVCVRTENPNFGITNFDDIFSAFLTIFQCISLEGWTDVMYMTKDANSSASNWIFLLMIIFGSFFAVNLALAVLYVFFRDAGEDSDLHAEAPLEVKLDEDGAEVKDEEGNPVLMTREEQNERDALGETSIALPEDANPVREFCYHLVEHRYFGTFIMVMIVLNTVTMACEFYDMENTAPDLVVALFWSNIVFTAIFVGEMILKLIAFNPDGYIKDNMNIFDGTIVLFSIVELIAGGGGALSVLRAFRMLRILKLARSWKQLQIILDTVIASISSVSYLSLILLLMVFIYALVGMQVFGHNLRFCESAELPRYGGLTAAAQGKFVSIVQYQGPTGTADRSSNYQACFTPCFEEESIGCGPVPVCVEDMASLTSNGKGEVACIGAVYANKGEVNCPGNAADYPSGHCTTAWNLDAESQDLLASNPELFLTAPNNSVLEAAGLEPTAWVGGLSHAKLDWYIPRHNFDSFGWAMLSIFQVLTGENWNEVMYDSMRFPQDVAWTVALYYVSLTIIGNYIFLNLFLAILLDNFAGISGGDEEEEGQNAGDDDALEGADADAAGESIPSNKVAPESVVDSQEGAVADAEHARESPLPGEETPGHHRKSRSQSTGFAALKSTEGPKKQSKYEKIMEGNSLFIFSPENPVRQAMARIVGDDLFEYFIIFLILFSMVTLAMDHPGLDVNSPDKEFINICDIVFTVLFTIEMVMKVIALGFVLGDKAYLKDAWNWIDFIVVLAAYTQFIPNADQYTWLKALRTIRALRPLRMVSRSPGMKVVVLALFQAIPAVANVLLVCMLFYIIFGILGLQLMRGVFHRCVDKETGVRLPFAITRDECLENSDKYEYVNSDDRNFDNIFSSILCLFEVATLEMWLEPLYDGIDAQPNSVGLFLQPMRDANPWMAFFFVAFVVMGAFFVMNLFVGVIIDKFNEMKEKAEGGSVFLTDEQKNWVSIQRHLSELRPMASAERPTEEWRADVYDFVRQDEFDMFIMANILLNVVFMSMLHYDQSVAWDTTLFVANIFFLVVFTTEMILKLIAYGPLEYIKDGWNKFDAFCVIASIVDLVWQEADPSATGPSPLTILRVFRVARIFRLIPKAKGLKTLFTTLLLSLPALFNVGSVLFLMFFIFAVMGMSFFGTVLYGENIGRHANYETFFDGMLLLFRMCTGESWDGIMHDAMLEEDCILLRAPVPECSVYDACTVEECSVDANIWVDMVPVFECTGARECFAGQSAFDTSCNYENHCGNAAVSIIFHIVFIILCAFVMLNLVIAIILDNFDQSNSEQESPIGPEDMQIYVEKWAEFDPRGTYYIPASKIVDLLQRLPPPLGFQGTTVTIPQIQKHIMSIQIPDYNGQVHFLETLHALTGSIAGTDLPEEELQKLKGDIANKLPSVSSSELPRFTAAHYHAALFVQAAVRGFLLRYHTMSSMRRQVQKEGKEREDDR